MTHRESVLKKYDLEDKPYSLEELSSITQVPISILQEVYKRGIGAYKTQPESVRLKSSFVKNVDAPMRYKLSKEQWAMARVYSFLDGNPKHDNDLRENKKGGGLSTHLRPHPTQVPTYVNLLLKEKFASECDCYTVAFNDKDLADIDFSTEKTRDLSNVGYLLANSDKPVIFNLCYYVRFSSEGNYHITHIVCCIKVGNTIYMCDSRDQNDISLDLTNHIKTELERLSGLKLHIVNACFDGKKYIYLQRFKGTDFGWCQAWSLFFLQHFIRMGGKHIVPQLYQLYALIDKCLQQSESNHYIEQWYESNLKDVI